MKVAVLDYWERTVDIIEVNEDWLHNEFVDWLLKTGIYESRQELQDNEDELIETFLYTYCNYDPNNTYYLADYKKVSYYTHENFAP